MGTERTAGSKAFRFFRIATTCYIASPGSTMGHSDHRRKNLSVNLRSHLARFSLEHVEPRLLLSAARSAAAAPAVRAASTADAKICVQPQVSDSASSDISGYTPQQISQAYGFNNVSFANGTIAGDGAGQTIGIV